MGDRDYVIEKLKKLYKHAQSAEKIGSEAEAQAFGLKVQQMITQYNLDRAVLEETNESEDEVNPIVDVYVSHEKRAAKRRYIDWQHTMAKCIADAHFCQVLHSKNSNAIWFVGRKVQAEMAVEVFAQLLNAAEEIADKEYVRFFYECKAKGDIRVARGFRQGFLSGFAYRLFCRYRAELLRQHDEAAKVKGAMVLFKSEREKVQEFIDEMFADKRLTVVRVSSLTEYMPSKDLLKNPAFQLLFKHKGYRWGVIRGGKTLLGLFMTESDAEEAIDEMEKSPKDRYKKYHAEGMKRGNVAANSIDIGGGSQKQVAS